MLNFGLMLFVRSAEWFEINAVGRAVCRRNRSIGFEFLLWKTKMIRYQITSEITNSMCTRRAKQVLSDAMFLSITPNNYWTSWSVLLENLMINRKDDQCVMGSVLNESRPDLMRKTCDVRTRQVLLNSNVIEIGRARGTRDSVGWVCVRGSCSASSFASTSSSWPDGSVECHRRTWRWVE